MHVRQRGERDVSRQYDETRGSAQDAKDIGKGRGKHGDVLEEACVGKEV
jgi:hypothetical protein